jgi:ssDNA-binding Zn-finger/Zn-ribbon topoisomerase 1
VGGHNVVKHPCPSCRSDIEAAADEAISACSTCGALLYVTWLRAMALSPARFSALTLDERTAFWKTQLEVWSRRELPCQACGAATTVRGRRGETGRGLFIGCTKFPDCKATRPLGLRTPCPSGCGGELVAKSWFDPDEQRWVSFVGCSNYSNDQSCIYKVWREPIFTSCPQCKAPFTVSEEVVRPTRDGPLVGPNRYPKGHCNRCGATDHTMATCSKPQPCHWCGSFDHSNCGKPADEYEYLIVSSCVICDYRAEERADHLRPPPISIATYIRRVKRIHEMNPDMPPREVTKLVEGKGPFCKMCQSLMRVDRAAKRRYCTNPNCGHWDGKHNVGDDETWGAD